VHPDDVARVQAIGDDLVAGRIERADYEFRILLPAGQGGGERWVLTRAQRFQDSDGRGLRLAGVSVDISQRKRAEAEHQRLEDQLRQAQKLEAIGTLAGGIAHDFNNILSAILGYGELALKGAAEGSAQRRHIDAALAAGQRAKSLVERILAFSRSGMGQRVPVHVQSVVHEALDAIATGLPPAVRLHKDLRAGDASVLGDATQIHQVVMNLCANAVQAMKADGQLSVTLEAVQLDAPLTLSTNTLPVGSYVRLVVADTGAGIDARLLDRIFDPFFTTKEVGVGTGLGLSMVHGIVTDLGGGIAVDSRVGVGSRFSIHLPAHGVVAAPAVAAAATVPRGNGETVLLVDDEEPLVRLGEEMLAELGYEPVGFVSSTAALAALRAEPGRFDAVLSDESMPGLTGSELAAEAHRLRPSIAIVLMSGYVSPSLTAHAREAGVAEVLAKPLAACDIARALAAALRLRPV
jgi:signal transduction histidine kinase/ActR/RegA family two-component response regulator